MTKMNKCKNCDYYANKHGYGQCYGQKNAPQVDEEECCEEFVPAKECVSRPALSNAEAKEIMKRWYLNGTEGMNDERLGYIEGWFYQEDKMAFELAIKALEAPQVAVFTETADEQAIADLKAELQSVIEEIPQGRPIFNREELEQALNYWYEHLEVGNEEQNKVVWCAINTIKYCIEHSSGYQKGNAE